MSSYSEALSAVTGRSWLDDVARATLGAAERKFSSASAPPAFRVELQGGSELGADDAASRLPDSEVPTLAEPAVRELVEVLPDSETTTPPWTRYWGSD